MTKSFPENQSLSYYQKLMREIYGLPGDRNFSLSDLLVQQQRFTMRALKGIRKKDHKKLTENLANAFSWAMSVANRLHLHMDDITWERFPAKCSYCGKSPCECKAKKQTHRARVRIDSAKRPGTLKGFQRMFADIYPVDTRTLSDAGVHLGEEMGEVSEAVHAYLSEHKKSQLVNIQEELADFVSCIFGVANSAKIDLAKESAKMFRKNCFVCHDLPCSCSMAEINMFQS